MPDFSQLLAGTLGNYARQRSVYNFKHAPIELIEMTAHKLVGNLRSNYGAPHTQTANRDITQELLASWCPPTRTFFSTSHSDDRGYWLWPSPIQRNFDLLYAGRDGTAATHHGLRSEENNSAVRRIQERLRSLGDETYGRFLEYEFKPDDFEGCEVRAYRNALKTSIAIYDVEELSLRLGLTAPSAKHQLVALTPRPDYYAAPGNMVRLAAERIITRETQLQPASIWSGL